MPHRGLLFLALLLASTLLLGACTSLEDLGNTAQDPQLDSLSAEASALEEAEFYQALLETTALFQIPVLMIGGLTLVSGWKLGRLGLGLNGFVIAGLLSYTALKINNVVEDETSLRALSAGGGVLGGIAAFYLYNLMALLIGGAVGTTLMGGTWLQVVDNVPPQLLVFASTFISAMIMFMVFRLFLVAFSAIIGAVLLMIAYPFEALGVIPVAAIGILIQTGIAWWIQDDIFRNLRGDMRASMGEAFGQVVGPFGVLRERQREGYPSHEQPAPAQPWVQRKAKAPAPTQSAGRYPSPGQHPAQAYPAAPPPQGYPGQYQAPAQPPVYPAPAPLPPQQYPAARPPQVPPGQYPAAPAPIYTPPPQTAPAPVYKAPPPVSNPPLAPNWQGETLVDQNLGDQTLVDQKAPTAATIKHRATVEDFHLVLSDGRTFPLGPFIGSTLGIGRAPDNQVIVNDVQVSGHHLKILVEGESLQIWDNHSTNGSLFNEQKLSSEQTTPLIMGDVVQIGAVKLWIAPLSAR